MFNTIISVVCAIQTFVQEKITTNYFKVYHGQRKSHNCTVQFEAGEENEIIYGNLCLWFLNSFHIANVVFYKTTIEMSSIYRRETDKCVCFLPLLVYTWIKLGWEEVNEKNQLWGQARVPKEFCTMWQILWHCVGNMYKFEKESCTSQENLWHFIEGKHKSEEESCRIRPTLQNLVEILKWL